MGAAAPVIAAVAGVVGTAYSVYSGIEAAERQEEAADEAMRIGRENAANIEAETAEQARRLKAQQEQEGAKARAVAASSGLVSSTGTLNTFLEDLDKGHAESLAWLERSGANRSRIAELSGGYTAQTGYAQASSTRASTAGNAATGASNIYKSGQLANWW
jgi:hypothetical protein